MVDEAVRTQAKEILKSFANAQVATESYFATIYKRMPIISKKRFCERLPSLLVDAPADFIALCLCMFLLQQHPLRESQNLQPALYVMIKNILSLLECSGYLSLHTVQCRLLVAFYEIGHGIYPAALISIGASARMSQALGITRNTRCIDCDTTRMNGEEERRIWWAVVNLDR